MRILIISNFYPPHYIGGYELGCCRVVEALRSRGYDVKVLTSTYGVKAPCNDKDVYRVLPINIRFRSNRSLKRLIEFFWFDYLGRKAFSRIQREYRPDVVYVWNMVHLPISMVMLAQAMGVPVYFYISDKWFSVWEQDGWYKFYKHFPLLRVFFKTSSALFDRGLKMENIQFNSHFIESTVKNTGKKIISSQVIHWGIDEGVFTFKPRLTVARSRLLYVGQIVEHKGVHIVIEALHVLVHDKGLKDVTLSIVGHGNEAYIKRLKELVSSFKLEAHVDWKGFVKSDALPRVYQEHDILIFSSLWEEPFSITLVEALSSGLAVVSTMTGGTGEILKPGANALSYAATDPKACADQVALLIQDQNLYEQLRLNARRTIEGEFRFKGMIDKIEQDFARSISER